MLPIELDHKILSTVPAPAYKYINSVFQAFQTILSQNIIPYFRNDRGVSLVQLADLRQSIVFSRMEDEENKILLPTLLLRQKRSWTILIHENLLDYLAHILSYRAEFKEPARGNERARDAQIFRVSFETPFRASCLSQLKRV